MKQIDLNSDLGESFGAYTIGNDSEVLRWVSSANIACGMHAGDRFVMHRTVRLGSRAGRGHRGASRADGSSRIRTKNHPHQAGRGL